MSELAIEDATPDTNVTGTELFPASDGGAAKCIAVSQIKDFTLSAIADLVNAGTVDVSTNAVYLRQNGALVPVSAQTFAAAMLGYAFGLAGAASLDGNEVFAIKNGNTLQSVTLSALKAWLEDELSATHIAALDSAAALADEQLFAVSQDGTDKKATLAVLKAYCLAGLYASATASTGVLTANDYVFVYRNNQLQKVKYSDLGLATGNVSTSDVCVEGNIPRWTGYGNTLNAGVELTDTVAASPQGATRIPSESAVRAAITASASALQTAINGKQATLTFDNVPTSGSNNPVKSGGVYGAIADVASDLATHANNANTHVTSADKAAWDSKQSALTFDNTPTSGSNNPVKSSGILAAINALRPAVQTDASYNSKPTWTGMPRFSFAWAYYATNLSGTESALGLFFNMGTETSPDWKFVATMTDTTPAST